MALACKRSGRNLDSVKLIAVSKTKPIELIQKAFSLHQMDFGENYAQELLEKAKALPKAHWHFIGPLQSNKAKVIALHSQMLHTLDRLSLAKKLNSHLEALNKTLDCLIQVNINKEPQKAGVAIHDLFEFYQECKAYSQLSIRGLMCIPDSSLSEKDLRGSFQKMKEALAMLNAKASPKTPLTELSMGMSADFEIAIEEGATLIRVGSLIFGDRPSPGFRN